MTIAGTHPHQGLRVALELESLDDRAARYRGAAFTPSAQHPLTLDIDTARGGATLQLAEAIPSEAKLDDSELAFMRQLGRQLWRQATQTPEEQGGGRWARRVQRWRGPK